MTVATCLAERETLDGHCQKVYSYTYAKRLEVATEELIGSIRRFVQYWALEDIISASGEEAITVVTVPSTGERYLTVVSELFETYVTKELGNVYDCYVTKVDDHYHVTVLGKVTTALRLEGSSYLFIMSCIECSLGSFIVLYMGFNVALVISND